MVWGRLIGDYHGLKGVAAGRTVGMEEGKKRGARGEHKRLV